MTRAISMENRGLVSVIIPNYNHGKYLEQRIESVLNQTYPHIELIILDDCSPDDSMSVIERYRHHSKISHIVRNEINVGSPFKQWAKGIELAKGEFVWIAESDDWCEPTMLNYLVEGMQQDDRCTISYCQSYCIDDQGIINWTSSHPRMEEIIDGKTFVGQHMLRMNGIFNASMALWRRDCYSHIKHDLLEYRFCGDWIFWIRVALQGKVAVNGRVLNYFRKHGNDVSGAVYSSGYNFKEELKVLTTLKADGVVDNVQLSEALKAKFKQFWQRRSRFSRQDVEEIADLFRRAIPSKLDALKIRSSAVWQSLKRR